MTNYTPWYKRYAWLPILLCDWSVIWLTHYEWRAEYRDDYRIYDYFPNIKNVEYRKDKP